MFKGPIALGTIRTSSVLGLRLIVQAGTLLLLASTLGADRFGFYVGLGAMAVLLGTLANFGTHLTLLRDVSRSSRDEDADAALRLALGTTAFCGAILFFVYIFLCSVLFPIPSDAYWVVMCLGTAEILFQPFLVIAAIERHGRGQVVRSQLLLVLPLLFRFLVMLAVAWCTPKNPLFWCVLGHLISIMFVLGCLVVLMPGARAWHQPFRWQVARRSHWGDLSGYAVMNVSTNGVAELDKVLALRFLPLDAAGIYSAASRIVGALVLPVMAMILAAIPRLFREGLSSGRRLQYWLFTIAFSYGFFAALVMICTAPWIEFWLGDGYAGVGEFIGLLSYAVPAVCVRAAATNILTTLERPWVRVSLELVGWLVIVVLTLVFVQSHGSQGLAFSIICAEWFLAISSVALINIISTFERNLFGGDSRND